MYTFFITLFIICLLYVQKLKSSRIYKIVFKLPPGLRELPIFGSSLNFLGNSEDTMKTVIQAVHNTIKLGGATRFFMLNMFYMAFTDASDIAEILTNYLEKDYLYFTLKAFTGNGSAFAPASISKVRRQIMLPSFNSKILNSFVDLFYEESVRLTEVLAPHAGTGRFSMQPYLNAWSFDTIINPSKAHAIKQSIFDTLLKSNLSDEEICEEIIVLIAGTELTGLAIGFTLVLLGLYPLVQDKVYKELHDVFSDSGRSIVKEDLSKLNYLDMVVKETLRLYPPAPLIARKSCKDLTLSSGKIVPAGVGVVALIIGLHRNPKYWGLDVEHFDPDRFLPQRFEKVHANAYLPFSYGARNCIGTKYGLMTMKIALSTILRKYKIVGEPAQGPVPNIRTKYEIFTKPVNNFEIELVNRI